MSIDLSQYYKPGVDYNTSEYARYGYMPAEAYYALYPSMRGLKYDPTFSVGGGLNEQQLNIPGIVVADVSQTYQAAGGTGVVILPESGKIEDITFSTPIPTGGPSSYPDQQTPTGGSNDMGVLLGIGLLSGLGIMLKNRKSPSKRKR